METARPERPVGTRIRRVLLAVLAAWTAAGAMAAEPLNLLRNGSFDAGASAWSLDDGLDDAAGSFAAWTPVAAPGTSPRGSLLLRTNNDRGARGASQCVPVSGGGSHQASARVRPYTSLTAAAVLVSWFGSGSCTGFLAVDVVDQSQGGGPWATLEGTVAAPNQARSARVALRVNVEGGTGTARALFDEASFGPTGVEAEGCVGVACLDGVRGDRRFAVQVSYDTALGGGASGNGVPLSLLPVGAASGLQFWFFDETNPELLLKVLDGCAINGHYWVFYAAVTNVGFQVRVFDLAAGTQWTRFNPDGRAAVPQQDIEAFPCS